MEKMKKTAVAIIVMTFFLAIASQCFAGNDFEIKGIVTEINGNQIKIKDDNGEEMTIDGSVDYLKVGDPILLKGEIFNLRSSQIELTTEDVDFLKNQCNMEQVDVDVIPQLDGRTQAEISEWIAAKDCKKLTPLKVSRDYYRQLSLDKVIPLAPAGWDIAYLTDAEWRNYLEILENAPW